MKTFVHSKPRGVALIIVMIAIFVLAVLVGAFAYSMKVETKLAMNANREAELIWLGRSGVEMARYVVAQQAFVPGEPYDALNQKWANGPGSAGLSNSPLANISLVNHKLGNGSFTVRMADLDRKFNINRADEPLLQQALTLMNVDAGDIPTITSSILDWIDADDNEHLNGAESDYYQGLNPPYYPKNKPIDDLSELLLIKGILDHQELYSTTNHTPAAFQKTDRLNRRVGGQSVYTMGLVDLFTALSSASGKVNVNTASATTLQAIPMVDANVASQIIQMRAGPDGTDGTDDDTPFRTIGEVINAVPDRQIFNQIARYCDVRSSTFAVDVDAEIGGYTRTYHAIIGRNSPRDVQILSFYWD